MEQLVILKKYLKEKERSDTLENINKKLLEDYQTIFV